MSTSTAPSDNVSAAPSADAAQEEANRDLVRGIFAEMSRGNVRALSDAMADELRWTFPGHWSWSGTWAPKDEVVQGLLRPLMEQFGGVYRTEADLILADGDRVVAQVRGHATTTRGEPYEQTYCFIFRVAEGRLTEVIEHCDTALVERVLERPSRRAIPAPMR